MKKLTTLSLLAMGTFASYTASAATATTDFQVTASIEDSCTVDNTGDMAFGTYAPLSGLDAETSIDIQITCTNQTPFSAAMNTGLNGTNFNRQMTNGATPLNYNIYTENTHTDVWGDGTNSTHIVADFGTGSMVAYTAYGLVPASQTGAESGSYTDQITVTVTY